MSDEAETKDASGTEAAPTTTETTNTDRTPSKKPGLIRKGGLIALVVIGGLLGGSVWCFLDGVLLGALQQAAERQGLQLDERTKVHASLLAGRLDIDQFGVLELGETEPIVATDAISLDYGLMSIFGSDTHDIEELTITGLRGRFRRQADGRVPVLDDLPLPAEETASDATAQGDEAADHQTSDAPGVETPDDAVAVPPPAADLREQIKQWRQQYQTWRERALKAKEWLLSDATNDAAGEPQYHWPEATRYPPSQDADIQQSRWLVRRATISGRGLELPDQTPLDIAGFQLQGEQLSNRPRPGETMHLAGTFTTAGAGAGKLGWSRSETGGELAVSLDQVDAATLADPDLLGDLISRYGARGQAAIRLQVVWQADRRLDGQITIQSDNLQLRPDGESTQQAHQLATFLGAAGPKAITWTIRLGGTTNQPRVTDWGITDLIKQLTAGMGADQLAALKGRAEAEWNRLRSDYEGQARAMVDEKRAELEAKQAELTTQAEAQLNELKGQAAAQQQRLAEMKKQYADTEQLKTQAQQQLQGIQGDIGSSKQQLQGLRDQIGSQEQQLTKVKQAVTAQQQRLDKLKQQVQQQESKLQELQDQAGKAAKDAVDDSTDNLLNRFGR